jgi:alkylated DNA repair dioxygenase AlkB
MSYPNGLQYYDNIISDDMHSKLADFLMSKDRSWSKGPDKSINGRLVQQYEYYYDYEKRAITSHAVEPIPNLIKELNNSLLENKTLTQSHNQVIVNFYLPGQGITPHKDHVKYFGDEIATISLGSGCIMDFANPETGDKYEQYLKPCSIAIMRDEARWIWTHSIASRKIDNWENRVIERTNRISITYRSVVNKS